MPVAEHAQQQSHKLETCSNKLPRLDRSAFASTNRLAGCGCVQCHASIPAALSCDSAVSPICAAHGRKNEHACWPCLCAFFFLVLHVSLLPHTCPRLCECARKYRKMMLQLPDNNRRFAALPAQYSAACDRRLSLFGVSCRGIFFFLMFFFLLLSFFFFFLLLFCFPFFSSSFSCFFFLFSCFFFGGSAGWPGPKKRSVSNKAVGIIKIYAF